MSFEKINQKDIERPDGRECILIYGFGGKDLEKIKGYAAMMGIRDMIEIKKDMLDIKVGDILNDHIKVSQGEEGPKDRAIIFNAFSWKKLNAFIGNFKSTGIAQPLLATVTPTSINWPFRDLVSELQREREAIAKSGQGPND